MTCTIFENIFDKEKPNYILVDTALERIRVGKSRAKVEELRNVLDKEKSNDLKRFLPSVCFSGKFSKRYDNCMVEHSGCLVLDFDKVLDMDVFAAELYTNKYVYAAWVSPGGQGIKALIRIADGKKHREHFAALKELFPTADNSGVNESRVCYESYDPNIFINKKAEVFKKTTVTEKIEARENLQNEQEIFKNLLKWITNKGGSFAKGERNIFIFKLAASCCRFGIDQNSAEYLITSEYPTGSDFTQKEAFATIKSAYKSNSSKQGSAMFERGILVDKTTRKEVELPKIHVDITNDVVYGISVKENAIGIYKKGYERVSGINIPAFDDFFKAKKGEFTGLTGIGNYGKSSFYKWFFMMRILLYGEKFGVFPPEDFPPEEYYHDFVEILLGCDCTPNNPLRPAIEVYDHAFDFISNHIFYVAPKTDNPTPDYVMECFLELIIKEKIDGVCTDPYNRLSHSSNGERGDEYLARVLNKFHRFGQQNNVINFMIIHPKTMVKQANGNYPCPDAYDLNGGAMWNNMLDNLLVYHRPVAQTEPRDTAVEFHTKKIKRQKSVGKRGVTALDYMPGKRRFSINGCDYMAKVIDESKLSFLAPVKNYKPQPPPEQSEQMKRFVQAYQNSNNYNRDDWNEPNN